MNGWSCENCRMWQGLYEKSKTGTCRRHAPRPTFDSLVTDSEVLWPTTERDDYCGEFEGRVSLPVQEEP